MSLAKKLFKGSIAQTIMTVVNIAVGVFMLPFMISHLGESLYGIWILIGGFTASLYLFDFGFATAVTRFMARFINQDDVESANQVINSALVIYSCLALLVMTVTLFIMWLSPIWVEDPANERMVQLLIFLSGLGLTISFPFKAFAGIGTAFVRYDLMAWARITVKLVGAALTVAALLNGYQLIAVALVQLLSSILSDLAVFAIAKYLFKPLTFSRQFINRSTIKSLAGYSGWAFMLDMTRLVKGKADIFVIGAMVGTGPLTVYYVAVRLVEYSSEFLSKATGMTTPVFAGYEAKQDFDGLRSKVILFVRINFMLGAFAALGLVLLGEPLIELWMGPEFRYVEAANVLGILIIGRIVGFTFAPLSNVLMAISKPRLMAYLSFVEAFISLVLLYLALSVLEAGIVGAAMAMVSPFLVTRLIVLPLVIQGQIQLRAGNLYLKLIKPICVLVLATTISSYLIRELVSPFGIVGLAANAALISFIYWSLMLFCLTREEWCLILRMLPDKMSSRIRRSN